MPSFFQSPLWPQLFPHRAISSRKTSTRLEFKVPDSLKPVVEGYIDVCPACGHPVRPLRFRKRRPGKTNRIYKTAAATRYYYAPNCDNDSCFRSKPATDYQKWVNSYMALCS